MCIVMKDRHNDIMKDSIRFELMDVDNRYFMVNFDKRPNKDKVVVGEPWMFFLLLFGC